MTNSSFTLAKHTILPGTHKTVFFPAPNINTQIKLEIPVHVFHGKKPGPKIFIISAIHGDELNSIEIIRRVHEHINVKKLSGTIITVPVANIYGVILQSRYLPDRRDLNRSFPGSKNGTIAARLAHGIIKQIVKHCDYGIDLHTGAIGRINMPQLRVNLSTPGAKKLACYFGIPIILDAKLRDGSLRSTASELGIPLLVYEGGEALRYNELCIRAGTRGIINVLHHLKMMKSTQSHKPALSNTVITNTSRWVRSPASGLVQPVADAFTRRVKKDDVLAYIHDPFVINPSAKVVAPFEGIVIGQALRTMANDGDPLFHIASFKKIAGVQAYIEEYRDEISD